MHIIATQKANRVLLFALIALSAIPFPASADRAAPTGPVRAPSGGIHVPPPDLVISFAGYILNSCTYQGKYSRIQISATVKNQGKGPAAVNDWGIAVTAYVPVPLDVPPSYSVKPVAHGPKSLNPGNTFNVKLDLVIGPAKNNQGYPVYVQVDPYQKVAESNENNNDYKVTSVPASKQTCTAK